MLFSHLIMYIQKYSYMVKNIFFGCTPNDTFYEPDLAGFRNGQIVAAGPGKCQSAV